MSASSLRCLVLGRDPSGESHSLLTLLEPAEGIVRCLIRTPRGNGTTLPDLVDEGEVSLERAKEGSGFFCVRRIRSRFFAHFLTPQNRSTDRS